MFKVNNKDTRMMPIALFCVFIVNVEHFSHHVLNFEHIIADWDVELFCKMFVV